MRSVRRDLVLGLAVGLAFFAVEIPLLYRDGLVEADSMRVGYGIAHAIRSGEGLAARDLYGRTFSFGYYALFLAAYPLFFKGFAPLLGCMNGLNLACVSAAFIPLVTWMSALWGRGVALGTAVVLATTPVVFELGGAGHPEGPAWLALNLALALIIHGAKLAGIRDAVALLGSTVAAFGALAFRADALFAFPLFPLLAPLAAGQENRRRAFAAGVLVAAIAGGGFLIAQSAVVAMIPPRLVELPGGTFTGKVNIPAFLMEYIKVGMSVRYLLKGAAVWATGIGPLLLVAGFLGTIAAFRRPDRRFAWAAAAALLPTIAFWLPNPTPSRHFLMSFLVLVPAALLWLRERVPVGRFAAAVVLLLALNLASMAAAYPVVVRSYAWKYATLLPRRVNTWVPMGDPISNRIWTRRQVSLEAGEARQLAASGEPKLLVLGSFVCPRLLYEIYALSPSYAVDYLWRHGALLAHAKTPSSEFLIYDYAAEPSQITPREFVDRVAAAGDIRDFAVAIVPSDQPTEGGAQVPPGYRAFTFDLDDLLVTASGKAR